MSTATARPARPAQVKASLPLLLVISVIGLGLVFLGGYRAAYSAGLAGTPGTLTVASCGQSGRPGVCTGVFRAADGSVTDPAATVSASGNPAKGRALDVDRLGAGDYGPISLAHSVGWLALILFGLMLAASLPSSLLGRRAEGSPRAARAAGRLGFAVLALFVGAGVFGMMALVLSFTVS
ncbi:hypothetical protein [Streptacidiphilus anmyonensis]|uniref:hypothetical protein n=1 Tax=Streptacidiphilus anmyonensis TaxID=405782 RepID=UPI0005A785AA|nr:hypothetical protein [Streptacidiphilus anmyonensis]